MNWITVRQIYNFLIKVLCILTARRIDKKTIRQFIKHNFVGGFGVIINYTLFNVLVLVGFDIIVANAVTYVLLIIMIFLMQKFFTYRVRYSSVKQFILFLANAFLYFLFDTLLLLFLNDVCNIIPMVSKILSLGVLTPLSFLSQKYIVFKKKN